MDAYSVYRDIQKRTKGQFLIGVVGPVRTGKSTLIRRFLEVLALPYLSEKEQAEVRDALPLSGKDDHNGGAEICAERRRGAAAWGGRSDPAATDRLRRFSGAGRGGKSGK